MMSHDTDRRAAEKWGDAAYAGFQQVPDILLKKQAVLGLSPTDVLVLLNVTMHWWYADQRPFPRTTTIADRMGVDRRTVERALKRLSDLGLLTRSRQTLEGTERIVCDPAGLVARLEELARDDPNYRVRRTRVATTSKDESHEPMAL
jgi:DNA-binding transcriptional ArsR family regulator